MRGPEYHFKELRFMARSLLCTLWEHFSSFFKRALSIPTGDVTYPLSPVRSVRYVDNKHAPFTDAEWASLALEGGDAEVEVYILRKDKMALLCERDMPIPTPYISGLLAALLGLPKLAITKVSVYVDGDKLK